MSIFCFKQKTAYEMRISDWSSDVCSSDLAGTTLTVSGLISGAGTLAKAGADTLTLTGDNNHTGGTTITAGTLQLGNGGTTGGISGDVANNEIGGASCRERVCMYG